MAAARLRMSRTALIPIAFLVLCAVPVVAAAPWALVLLVVPALLAARVSRVGVDVADDGITVRSLVGAREVRWTELTGIRVGAGGHLWLVTTGGTEVRLPVLRARDLPRLADLSGGRIPSP